MKALARYGGQALTKILKPVEVK